MFTGIVQNIGKIEKFQNGELIISTDLNLEDIKIGSSICCNGVCLTAVNITTSNGSNLFTVNVGEETIDRTNLATAKIDTTIVNIEKSLKIGAEISGHFVYGHVDVTTSVIEIKKLKDSWEFKFDKKFKDNSKFIKEKASIAINGISLTIANVFDESFNISIIPHTYQNTNLQFCKIGDVVNIEFDYLARFLNHNYE